MVELRLLWPVRPPADPAANLGVLVSRARRALGDPAAARTGDGGGGHLVSVPRLAALSRPSLS